MAFDVPIYYLAIDILESATPDFPRRIPPVEPASAWYVLRITYQRELSVRDKLNKLGVENFVPTQRVRRRTPQGRFYYSEEAAVHNYVFVRTTPMMLRALKREQLRELRYVMQTIDGFSRFLIVPDDQMRNFIAVAGNSEERVLFLPPDTVDWSRGQRVRILGGPFEGVEGTFLRISKKHERRVVVQIAGLVAVATTALPACLVERV